MLSTKFIKSQLPCLRSFSTDQGYKSYARFIHLRDDPEKIAAYKHYHQNCFPEVLTSLHTVGIRKMQMYHIGLKVFMYYEALPEFNPEVDFPRVMELSPRCVEWVHIMGDLLEPAPEGKLWAWCDMDEVYSFQDQYDKFILKK